MEGYILVDCTGLDISSTSAQTISGIKQKLSDAIATGKQLILTHATYGTYPVTPISANGYEIPNGAINVYFNSKLAVCASAATITIS